MTQKVGSGALNQLSTKIRPKKAYKTNREDLGDPDPYKMVGRKRGGTIQEAVEQINDILIDPPKYKKISAGSVQYAREQAQIYGNGGILGKILSALGLGQYRSGILDKGKDKLTKSGVAGSPWHVDCKTGFKLLTNPDMRKITSKKKKLT